MTNNFPEEEWAGLSFLDFVFYIRSKMTPSQYQEFRDRVAELAHDPGTQGLHPKPEDIIALANLVLA